MNILETMKPGLDYQLLYQDYAKVVFSLGAHTFTEESLARSQELWKKSPEKYDGVLMGVTKVDKKDDTVHIEVAPMQYSFFRYVAKCKKEGTLLDKIDEIFPIGVASISYFIGEDGRKQFVMGIRGRGNIEEGCLEFVPQGFCDNPGNRDMQNYVERTITRELQEELTERGKPQSPIRFRRIKNLGLALEMYASDYALLLEGEIEGTADFINKGIVTEEHQEIVIVSENDLEEALSSPTAYLKRRIPDLKQREIKIQGSSKTLMYTHMTQQEK